MKPKAIEAYKPTVYTTRKKGNNETEYRYECYYTEVIGETIKNCHTFGGPYKTFEKAEKEAKKFYYNLTGTTLGDDIDMTL